jgi:hypothetical protein
MSGTNKQTLDTPVEQIAAVSEGKVVLDAQLPMVIAHENAEVFRNDFGAAFGLGPSGASLVRPDGYVAWRSLEFPIDPAAAIAAALTQAGCRGTAPVDSAGGPPAAQDLVPPWPFSPIADPGGDSPCRA